MTTLGELVMDAIRDPDNADTADLLRAASAFLDTAKAGDPDLLGIARNLANRALDWSMLQDDESLQELRVSARAYSMASQITGTTAH